jgi:hypothetical protein
MPVNNAGSYSGRSVTKAQTSLGQDGISGSRSLSGQTPAPQPPKTTGSAPTFQNSGSGCPAGKDKPGK